MMKLSQIHHILCDVRKQRNIPQKEIGTALNVEQATVSLYETGKRGIPLDLLDEWLQILEIEVKITPREFTPVNSEEETRKSLALFNTIKKRRNYLIAELRAMTAQKIMPAPEFAATNEETGESAFWPYSLYGEQYVGLIETRYDHPQQKYMAVEYTGSEVNIYKFLSTKERYGGQSKPEWLNADRLYFTEDDFLTIGGAWEQEVMNERKITVLRRNKELPDGVEIVETGGFSPRALLEMQENFNRLRNLLDEVEATDAYIRMDAELESMYEKLGDIAMENRLQNNTLNPEFTYWGAEDQEVIDVPLWNPERGWYWVEEGVEWTEEFQEMEEIQIHGASSSHEHLRTHRNEDGTRVIGLIGEDKKPALFKSNPSRSNAIYRTETNLEDLSEEETLHYKALVKATEDLESLRTHEK